MPHQVGVGLRTTDTTAMLARETGLCLQLLKLLVERQDEWTPIGALAAELGLSHAYASKLCHRLRKADYLEAKQGTRGGVALSGRGAQRTLLDLASDLGDPFVAGHCMMLRAKCIDDEPCPLHEQWSRLHASALALLAECPIGGHP
jgi:Rrf2 family transcriptional regulator, iron-sulfur cluster assembly transcription factor